jgi:hypothetical protein
VHSHRLLALAYNLGATSMLYHKITSRPVLQTHWLCSHRLNGFVATTQYQYGFALLGLIWVKRSAMQQPCTTSMGCSKHYDLMWLRAPCTILLYKSSIPTTLVQRTLACTVGLWFQLNDDGYCWGEGVVVSCIMTCTAKRSIGLLRPALFC